MAGTFARLRRHLPLILLTAVLFVGLAAGLTFLQKPKYTASATLLFAPKRAEVGREANVEDSGKDETVDTQTEAMRSPALVSAVINRLQLAKDPEFNTNPGVVPAAGTTAYDEVVNAVLASLKTRRVGQTLLFQVSFTDRNPVKAARIANAFAEGYITGQVDDKLNSARSSNGLLQAKIDEMRGQVETAERAVQQFKAQNNLLSSQGATLTEQEISNLNQQLATARVQEAEASAQLSAARRQIGNGSNGGDVASALQSPTISQLRQQRAEVSRSLAQIEARYGPKHPDIINQKRALADIDREIDNEVKRIVSGLESGVDVAHQRADSIRGSMAGARSELVSGNSASVRLNELERDAEAARTLYEAFLARSKETAAQEATAQADARITAPATPPAEPSSPNVVINLFLGLILGLGAGVGIAYLRERWNIRLSTMDDVESRLALPYMGALPTLASSVKKPTTKDPVEAILAHPLSSYAEAFRGLGTALLHGEPGVNVKVVGITSALPKEGKTTTSICLARVLALGGSRVVLVDCDLRRHSTTDTLFSDVTVGMIEVLQGKATLDEALLLDERSGAYVLPIAKNAHLAKSPFESPAMDQLLEDLKARFDVVVLDTAPVLPVVDTRVLAKKMDALVMVVRWRTTPVKAVQSAMHLVESVGGRISGAALSLVDLKAQSRSGYGDPSYYYKDFKGYYIE